MRFSTRVHAAIDYLLALVLVAAPWLLGLRGAAAWVPVAAGVLLALYSLSTDYEFSAVKRLQIPLHLWLDGLVGVLLAISPWLFGFDRDAWIPHLLVGLFLIVVAAVTQTVPGYERRAAPAGRP